MGNGLKKGSSNEGRPKYKEEQRKRSFSRRGGGGLIKLELRRDETGKRQRSSTGAWGEHLKDNLEAERKQKTCGGSNVLPPLLNQPTGASALLFDTDRAEGSLEQRVHLLDRALSS